MKRLITIMMVLILSLSLAACGGEDTPAAPSGNDGAAAETEFVSMTFGDITMSVPSVFGAVTENSGSYVSAGPDASIVVTPAIEVEVLPSEWDESIAQGILEPMYGATYTDLELSVFEGDVNMNGNTAVYFAFYGKNANGKDRLVQVVYLFNADQTEQYVITFMHSEGDEFFTSEVGGNIINSITLGN